MDFGKLASSAFQQPAAAASNQADQLSAADQTSAPVGGLAGLASSAGLGDALSSFSGAGASGGAAAGGLDFGSVLKTAQSALGGAGGQGGNIQLPDFLSHIDVQQLASKLPPGLDLSAVQGLLSQLSPKDVQGGGHLNADSLVKLIQEKLGGDVGAQLGSFAQSFLGGTKAN
ncbi:hypothetical protein M427DRAFT_62567 [Gonapodya prolifera JEL478]|uniref:Uncharacterized protein n=1 Tax=Gonapodya prolifera (strain JEL478) TaxID=1344416 RepID=A0A139A1N4_GONPJ|nr:hypothetical protein M427DRAFT_62567 [Gonapodya prolifera JEL478]|eukprot:KXS10273.1 hypothetical protein M427DRAFT_62567 [Gonapodya prolifera JEL478]